MPTNPDLAALSAAATDPFDCAGLWEGVQRVWLAATGQAGIDHATADQLATDYLRTRIEAAFVPVEHHVSVIADHDELLQREIARAEAAEAENAKLREALRELRSYGCPVCNGDCGSANPPVISCPMQSISATLGDEHAG